MRIRTIAITAALALAPFTSSIMQAQTSTAPVECPAFIQQFTATDIVKVQLIAAQFKFKDLVFVPITYNKPISDPNRSIVTPAYFKAVSKYGASGIPVDTECNGSVAVFLDAAVTKSNETRVLRVYDRIYAFFINTVTAGGALRPIDDTEAFDSEL